MCSSAVLLHSLLSLTFHLEARIAPIGNEEEKTMTSGLNRCRVGKAEACCTTGMQVRCGDRRCDSEPLALSSSSRYEHCSRGHHKASKPPLRANSCWSAAEVRRWDGAGRVLRAGRERSPTSARCKQRAARRQRALGTLLRTHPRPHATRRRHGGRPLSLQRGDPAARGASLR